MLNLHMLQESRLRPLNVQKSQSEEMLLARSQLMGNEQPCLPGGRNEGFEEHSHLLYRRLRLNLPNGWTQHWHSGSNGLIVIEQVSDRTTKESSSKSI